MRYASMTVLVLVLALLWTVPPRPETKAAEPAQPEDLADKVDKAIKKAIKYFRDREKGTGHWERVNVLNTIANHPGGMSALATLSLLYAGVPPSDEMMQRSLERIRGMKPGTGARTYVVSLHTMILSLANQPEDKERIQDHVKWLLDARVRDGGKLLGWTYTTNGNTTADNSNMQYAVLGLHEAFIAGAKIEPEVWQEIREFYERTAVPNGQGLGWSYRTGDPDGNRFTMTTAGACGLLIADMNLKASKQQGEPKCDGPDCAEEKFNESIRKALLSVGQQTPGRGGDLAGIAPHMTYALYGIERVGRFSGQRFLGEKDWYRIGCEALVQKQNDDGSFNGEYNIPEISTAFVLLFLAKGRTPVLISKMVHSPQDDWNRNVSDARNLTNFCSKELFKNTPLAWQVFDTVRGFEGKPSEAKFKQLTGELLQSPIAYISGKEAPTFEKGEITVLKDYLENGGFIMAEACCGSEKFFKGFTTLIEQDFYQGQKGYELKKLSPTHPVYTASGKYASDAKKFPLWGLEMGCKTVLILSEKGLSCYWESNFAKAGHSKEAFEMGVNIVAYATGLEPPRPRLTKMEVVDTKDRPVERGYFKIGQVNNGTSREAPRAISNLMNHMSHLGLDVVFGSEYFTLGFKNVMDYRFLYMHGKQDFTFTDAEKDKLRFHLETGGILFADACCGARAFDTSFRKEIGDLWKGKTKDKDKEPKLEDIPLTDELFSKKLNGEAITKVKCRREGSPDYRLEDPQLVGMKFNGRWVVIYSKYDIGCALEKHQSTDCLGHDHDSAMRLARAVVLYALRR
jgi:hypothetical protein